MESSDSPIDKYLVESTRKRRPRVCFMPTASGDSEEHIEKFYRAYTALGCRCAHLAVFRKPAKNCISVNNLYAELSQQDLIFVGGGNTFSMLAVWREWEIDIALRAVAQKGTILSGMSAGAICWFETAVTDSFGEKNLKKIAGLGFVTGICAAHFNTETSKKEKILKQNISDGGAQVGFAIDDGALVHINGNAVTAVGFNEGAGAYIFRQTNGRATKKKLQSQAAIII